MSTTASIPRSGYPGPPSRFSLGVNRGVRSGCGRILLLDGWAGVDRAGVSVCVGADAGAGAFSCWLRGGVAFLLQLGPGAGGDAAAAAACLRAERRGAVVVQGAVFGVR